MSVSNISSGYSYYQTANTRQQRKQEFDALSQALQSGNLSGAQQAFSELQQGAPSNNSSSDNGIVTDISALGQALASNDLSSAQSAFSTLQSDFKNAPPPPPPSDSSSSDATNAQSLFEQLANALQSGDLSAAQTAFNSLQQSAPQSGGSDSATSDSSNPLDTDLTTLSSALQSGDLTSAQTAFSQLQQDIQNAPPPSESGGRHHHGHGNDQVQQAFGDLNTALQNGDLDAAKTAFATLQSLSPNNQTAASTSSSASTDANGTDPISKDLASLNQALQNGDVSNAQSLFDTLVSDLQANAPRHHGVQQYQQDSATTTDSNVSVSA